MSAAGMPTDEAAAKVKHWNAVHEDFLKQTNPKRQVDRLNVGGGKRVAKSAESGIIDKNITKAEGANLRVIGTIDVEKYKVVAEHIRTDEVVLTKKQEEHIVERRGQGFYDKYHKYFSDIIKDPEYIFADKDHPNTALACKKIVDSGKYVNVVMRLAVAGDDPNYKNSIITAIIENEKRFNQRLRNNIPLYKKE